MFEHFTPKKHTFVLIMTLLTLLYYPFNCKHSHYKIIKKIKIGGAGRWDYLSVDNSKSRIFVAHDTLVNVINLKDGTVSGTIQDTPGVHGIAIVPGLNKGFISNGKDSSVTIFNLNTLGLIKKLRISGKNPDAILFDPLTQKVYTFNGRSSNATVLDAVLNSEVTSIALPGKPEFSVTDGKGKIFVNIESKNSLVLINSVSMKIEADWKLAQCENPSGLAIDIENHRLFTVCRNKVMLVLNSDNGQIISSLPIGSGVDGVVFDPARKQIISSNGEGTITVIEQKNANSYRVLENIPTQKGARTIGLDNNTHRLYLPTAEFEAAPEATRENPHPRASVIKDTFILLEIEPIQ